MAMTQEKLLDLLRCPRSKSLLVREEQALVCVDPQCRLRYEIKDEIPVMLIDEARELSPQEWGAAMQRHGRDSATGQSKSGST